jgi:protease YdgD
MGSLNRTALMLPLSLAALLLVAAGEAWAGFQPRTTLASDNRDIVESGPGPWQAIGRLNNESGGFCTAVLIGERQVLTAAHCLRRRGVAGQESPAHHIHFLAGYSRGEYRAHSRAVAIARSPRRGIQEQPADDWAIVTLAEPLGMSVGFLKLEPFGPSTFQADRELGLLYSQAGYSQDRAHILTRHSDCGIVGFLRGAETFVHRCEATHGDSGSPILALRDGTYSIVGLHVATARNEGFGLAIAASVILAQMPPP